MDTTTNKIDFTKYKDAIASFYKIKTRNLSCEEIDRILCEKDEKYNDLTTKGKYQFLEDLLYKYDYILFMYEYETIDDYYNTKYSKYFN